MSVCSCVLIEEHGMKQGCPRACQINWFELQIFLLVHNTEKNDELFFCTCKRACYVSLTGVCFYKSVSTYVLRDEIRCSEPEICLSPILFCEHRTWLVFLKWAILFFNLQIRYRLNVIFFGNFLYCFQILMEMPISSSKRMYLSPTSVVSCCGFLKYFSLVM